MMKYIDNDKQKGILHDWKKIRKKFKSLRVPEDRYNPLTLPLSKSVWHLILSERSKGKTTNLLLFGMCMNVIDGTTIEYIRQSKSQIAPMKSERLFETILKYDYISKVTDGKYNSCVLKNRKWYFCNRDENGNEIERANIHFMSMLNLEESETYKSVYNAPSGDWIIFDEFLSRTRYRVNEFIELTDLISTIKRERISAYIILSSNLVDKNSQYFNEFEIMDKIRDSTTGTSFFSKTSKGTTVYVEILKQGELTNEKKKVSNRMYFGFKNPLISNITGEDWAIENYPHIPEIDRSEKTYISKNHYIFFNEKYVRLDLVYTNTIGYYIECHWATKIYDDSIIYTIGDILDIRYRFKLGYSDIDKKFFVLKNRNKWYYATNDIGAFIEKYFNIAKQK